MLLKLLLGKCKDANSQMNQILIIYLKEIPYYLLFCKNKIQFYKITLQLLERYCSEAKV